LIRSAASYSAIASGTDIIDKRSGRNLLLEPDPGAKQYPDLGGLTVTPYTDYVTRMPGSVKWELDAGASPGHASLTGTLQNGLNIRRTLRLDGEMLHTETTLENTTAGPLAAVLQSRWEVDPGDLQSVVVRYPRQDGGSVGKALIEPEKMPTGSEYYNAGDQPDGEWRVVNLRGGPVTVNRFPKDQMGRCFLTWTATSENRVGLAVSSVRRVLQPGERVKLEADYGTE
jgi:hypothetical protein